MDGGRPEEQRDALEALGAHGAILRGGHGVTHGGRDLASEQLDRPEDSLVRRPTDPELDEEPIVFEDLVLEEDLLYDLPGRPDEVGATQRRRRVVVGA